MKKLNILLFVISIHTYAQNNVGIGTIQPDSSAILDISSPNKGVLIPRMSTPQRDANIASPAIGLQIFNTTIQCIEMFTVNGWRSACEANQTSTTLQRIRIEIPPQELRNIGSSPVEIVPAPPIGKYVRIVAGEYRLFFETPHEGLNFYEQNQYYESFVLRNSTSPQSTFLGKYGDTAIQSSTGNLSGTITAGSSADDVLRNGEPLVLTTLHGSNATQGNGTLVVYLLYELVDW